MKFFDMIADFFMTPVDSVMQWLNDMQVSIGVWWSNLWKDIGLGVAHFAVDGVCIFLVCYMVYTAYRMIITYKDETFSEFINKWMIGALFYFFARVGGAYITHFIGG